MPDCPLADDCPSFQERISGMGCNHYGDRGGMEWCGHYDQPISDLKTQPVKRGEEIVVDVTDIHESGAGVGRTEDGFIVMVDGVLPEARAKVKITKVHNNHARADEVERLPMEGELGEDDDDGEESDADDGEESDADDGEESDADDGEEEDEEQSSRPAKRERLGSRDNFWGN